MVAYIVTRFGKIPKNEVIVKEIPNAPRVKFRNYLRNLVVPEIDTTGSRIIVRFNDDNEEKLDFVQLTDLELKDIKSIKIVSSPHTITFPKYIDPKLAYLTGYLYGDGGFKDIRRSYLISGIYEYKMIVGDEFRAQIEQMIQPLFFQIFNLNTKMRLERITKGERLYYLNPTCKLVYIFFSRVMNFPEGPKKTLKIPPLLKSCPKEIQRWFIRGLMDADGDIRAVENLKSCAISSPRIKLKLADKEFVKEIKEQFYYLFDIRLTGPYSDTNRDWYIQGAKYCVIESMKKEVFYHPIKRWRIQKLVKYLI